MPSTIETDDDDVPSDTHSPPPPRPVTPEPETEPESVLHTGTPSKSQPPQNGGGTYGTYQRNAQQFSNFG